MGYPTFEDIDNKNYNDYNIKSTSFYERESKDLLPISQYENIKQCPYCYLELELHEFINHIYIHESMFTLFTDSEQCNLLDTALLQDTSDSTKMNKDMNMNMDNSMLDAPSSIMISNEIELQEKEDLSDPADDFEIIDKNEVVKQMKKETITKKIFKKIKVSASQMQVIMEVIKNSKEKSKFQIKSSPTSGQKLIIFK